MSKLYITKNCALAELSKNTVKSFVNMLKKQKILFFKNFTYILLLVCYNYFV